MRLPGAPCHPIYHVWRGTLLGTHFYLPAPSAAPGNYSPVLVTQLAAKKEGYSDVVYLDAKSDTYLEEVSSCNIFCVKGKTIKTPPLSVRGGGGSVLVVKCRRAGAVYWNASGGAAAAAGFGASASVAECFAPIPLLRHPPPTASGPGSRCPAPPTPRACPPTRTLHPFPVQAPRLLSHPPAPSSFPCSGHHSSRRDAALDHRAGAGAGIHR